MTAISCVLNGRLIELDGVAPTTTLLRYLRDHRGLAGTKEGCAEGDCGACTVVVADTRDDGTPTWRAVCSCLIPLPALHGRSIYTVEGVGRSNAPHAVQQALTDRLGSQCGYCTPGIIGSLVETAYRRDVTADWQIDDQMCGNLCRCTGYRPIRETAHAVAGTVPPGHLADALAGAPPARQPSAIDYRHRDQRFVVPDSWDDLWKVLESDASARLVAGATDLALEITKKHVAHPLLVSLEGIEDLRLISETEAGWHIGATATLTRVQERLGDQLLSLSKMIRWFASRQIRHRATVGGNICTASPIGDLSPVLLALGATLTLRSAAGRREVPLDAFWTGYRQTVLRPGEILESVWIPRPLPGAFHTSFKVSKRRELDISTVSAGMYLERRDGVVQAIRLAFGGVAATPTRARQTEAALSRRPWNRETVSKALELLDTDFAPLSDHRGSAWYRRTVARNLLLGFALESEKAADAPAPRPVGTVDLFNDESFSSTSEVTR